MVVVFMWRERGQTPGYPDIKYSVYDPRYLNNDSKVPELGNLLQKLTSEKSRSYPPKCSIKINKSKKKECDNPKQNEPRFTKRRF